jgi:transcriptional regulator with XRE-family HTH domain
MASALADRIAATHDPAEAVRIMRREIGLTEADLAAATGVDRRSVRRWLAASPTRPVRHERRIDDLRAIVEILADGLTENGIRQWLRARNRSLRGERPLDVLARGEFGRVQNAAEAFAQGYFV